jgi:hypothetical protein
VGLVAGDPIRPGDGGKIALIEQARFLRVLSGDGVDLLVRQLGDSTESNVVLRSE